MTILYQSPRSLPRPYVQTVVKYIPPYPTIKLTRNALVTREHAGLGLAERDDVIGLGPTAFHTG